MTFTNMFIFYIKYALHFLLQLFHYLNVILYNQTRIKKNEMDSSPSPEEKFILFETERYLSSFENTSTDIETNHELNNPSIIGENNNKIDKYNQQMDEIFYNIENYNKLMKTDNKLEQKWKKRILLVYTPRGNILMFYDCFKHGFSYFCDMQNIPYSLLNAVAMRYVRVFSCRDLYVDEKTSNNNECSPLIKIKLDFDKKEKEKEKEKYKTNSINKEKLKQAPFAKLKKYNITSSIKNNGEDEKQTDKTIQLIQQNVNTNTFIYLGKLLNFSFLQKKPLEKIYAHIIKEKISYKEFMQNIKNKI